MVNIGENALTQAIMTGSNMDTIIHTINLSENNSGATPKKSTQYIKPKVNIKNLSPINLILLLAHLIPHAPFYISLNNCHVR